MQRDPNVDRALGELWLISDILTADINSDFEHAKERARRWHPSVMPKEGPDDQHEPHLRRV